MKRTSIGISALVVACAFILVGVLHRAYTEDLVTRARVSAESSSTPTTATQSLTPALQDPLMGSLSNEVDAQGLSQVTWRLTLPEGNLDIKFYSKETPLTVAHIVSLTKRELFKDQPFHRVVPGFLVGGGNPQGSGLSTPLRSELTARPQEEGTVGIMRSGDPRSGDSQFYILLSRQPNLDRRFTAFGKVVAGLDLIKKIKPGTRFTASLF